MLENLGLGFTVTLLGLAVVFVILVLIILVIKLIAKAGAMVDKASVSINDKKQAKKQAKQQAKAAKAEETKTEEAIVEPQVTEQPAIAQQPDDAELVAVIAAACAVMMGTQPANIAVRSYKKVRRSAWANAGRRSQMM